jgi:hypothetical protein
MRVMMNNPNEYDDVAYANASMLFYDDVTATINYLWRAGATEEDIRGQFENAMLESEVHATDRPVHHGGGPKPKK